MGNWLTRFWSWVKEATMLWLAITVLVGALAIALLPTLNESRVRIVGLVLQLCGIMTVAQGISETRRFFGRPSLLSLWRNWVNRFPPFHRKIIMATVAGTMELSGAAQAHVWSNSGPDASIEERVAILEKNLLRVRDTTYEVQQKLDDESRSRENALVTERQLREAADSEIRNKLEATETGGLNLSLVGVVWLSVGLIFSTVPTEIVRFLD
jgi:hypothetical protein